MVGKGAESEATMGECGDVAWDKADGGRSSGRRRMPRHLTSKGPTVGDGRAVRLVDGPGRRAWQPAWGYKDARLLEKSSLPAHFSGFSACDMASAYQASPSPHTSSSSSPPHPSTPSTGNSSTLSLASISPSNRGHSRNTVSAAHSLFVSTVLYLEPTNDPNCLYSTSYNLYKKIKY